MKKLTVDEIIQGLIDAYERLLKLERLLSNDTEYPYDGKMGSEYYEVKGEIKALRWVLGQSYFNHLEEAFVREEEQIKNEKEE